MSTDTAQEDHGLTDEEVAALNAPAEEENNVDPNADPDAVAEPGTADQSTDTDPAADPDAAAGAGDANPAAAAADAAPAPAAAPAVETPAAATKQEAAPAPILIVQAPADAQVKLAQIAVDKGVLADKWEAGDLTGKEYQLQLDALNEQQFDIKQQVRDADLAQKLTAQQIQNQWVSDCNAFVSAHPEYADASSERHKLLNETIMAIARMPSNQGLSNEKALAKAHRMVQVELGESTVAAPAAAGAKQLVVPKPATPPTLSNVPAAAMNDTTGGEFAAIDKLAKSGDVDAYESALEKMTEPQRARYMRT